MEMLKKINLHHAVYGFEDIDFKEFKNVDEHRGKTDWFSYLNYITMGRDSIVWLVNIKDEVFVTSHVWNLHCFVEIAMTEFEEDTEELNIYIQEYASYEESYEVALSMQEQKPNCYHYID